MIDSKIQTLRDFNEMLSQCDVVRNVDSKPKKTCAAPQCRLSL